MYENNVMAQIAQSEYETEEQYDACEEAYINYKSELKMVLNKMLLSKKGSTETTSGEFSNSLIKLQKISIPTFSGKYSEWTTFRDLFVSLVHKTLLWMVCKNYIIYKAIWLVRQNNLFDKLR